MTDYIYIDNTNVVRLVGLKNNIDDEYINDATVTVTIKTKTGEDVEGVEWPITADYVDGSNGDYTAIIPHTLELIKGSYVAHVDAVGTSPNNVGNWQKPVKSVVRA